MATPRHLRPPLSDPPTRQQLDELDALMQRMLALPVEPAEAILAPDRAAGGTPPGQTEVSSAPAAPEGPARPAPVSLSARREEHPGLPGKENAGGAPGGEAIAPAAVYPSVIFCSLSSPGRTKPEELPAPVASPASPAAELPRLGLWLRALLGCNRIFDACTAGLGPLGRWLRGPRGRALLAWLGILLLAAALAWVALDGMGWSW